jgi:hypothetical protein
MAAFKELRPVEAAEEIKKPDVIFLDVRYVTATQLNATPALIRPCKST